MGTDRRRKHLGPKASAALPALWKALARKDWSHADLARELGVSTAAVSSLAYGDTKAGRETAGKLVRLLGVRFELWDKPCPPNWRPHAYDALRPKPKKPAKSSPFPVLGVDDDVGATGTDD